MEPEAVSLWTICPLYTGSNYIYNSLNGENETALYRQWCVIYRCPLRKVRLYNICVRNRSLKNHEQYMLQSWKTIMNICKQNRIFYWKANAKHFYQIPSIYFMNIALVKKYENLTVKYTAVTGKYLYTKQLYKFHQ
jgi:hypothetical protein